MYIASACDKIYASSVSIIGSVGTVTGPFFNVSQAMEKLGIEAKTLTQGEGKDPLNPFRPWKEGESEEIETVMEALYTHFVEVVAKARPKINTQELKEKIGARFFPASKAVEIGLIDAEGQNEAEVIALLAKGANLDPAKVQVIQMERKLWISNWLRGQSNLLQGTIHHKIDFNPNMESNFLKQLLFLQR
jgi:protease-4